jgi:acetoin:2,6-dichlorophenolindophenol oxidoreductase subunit beta
MPEARVITATEAILEALDLALTGRTDTYLIGEGVADPNAIFGTTKGLIQKYGPSRVIEMPVSENGMTGIAIGSALMGRRPIMTHQRVDFALLALEQLFNTAAKSHYVTNGAHKVPLTVRMVIGRGWGQGPQHSQSLESLFGYIPGLKVVMPSTPADFKGMLLASIEDDNPVIFIEHRWLHYVSGAVPQGYYLSALDGPHRIHEGGDLTIVASSYMTLEAMRAASTLSKQGCNVDLFDLRVLRPLDLSGIIASVYRTGRLIVCDIGWKTLGPGAEIVAQVVESSLDALKRPPVRIGLPDHPTPSSLSLAQTYYPDSAQIVNAAALLCGIGAKETEAAREEVIAARAGVPIDKPDPAFKGPF